MKRPRDGTLLCAGCFFDVFELEAHETIMRHGLFPTKGERVALGASGGKDSTVLMHLMTTLNERYGYGLQLVLVSVDEGIVGYRDDSLKTVHRNKEQYSLPLVVVSYKELFGWTMDEIVAALGGAKSSCTFCGVLRRQALDKGAVVAGCSKIVTGHNADDTAETILMNVMRADVPRLTRCVVPATAGVEGAVPRVKPLRDAYEKEIVLYAHFKKLDYFTTECTYSSEAFRGNARTLLKELEAMRPSAIADIIVSGEALRRQQETAAARQQGKGWQRGEGKGEQQAELLCKFCGYVSSQPVCRACVLLDSLNKGTPHVALRSSAVPSAMAPSRAAAEAAANLPTAN